MAKVNIVSRWQSGYCSRDNEHHSKNTHRQHTRVGNIAPKHVSGLQGVICINVLREDEVPGFINIYHRAPLGNKNKGVLGCFPPPKWINISKRSKPEAIFSKYTKQSNQTPTKECTLVSMESEDEQLIKSLEKRSLGILVPPAEKISCLINNFLKRYLASYHTLLHTVKGAFASNVEDIWENADIHDALQVLRKELASMLTLQPCLFDIKKSTLSLAFFDFFNLLNISKSSVYKNTFLYRVNYGDSILPVCHGEFLSALYSPQMPLEEKEAGYILLNILPQTPQITPKLLAQISADIKLDIMENEHRICDKLAKRIPRVYKKIEHLLQMGEYPYALQPPFFMSQRFFINKALYLGDSMGFCVPLALSFLYNISQYGLEDGLTKFKDIIVTLEDIHEMSYQTSLSYTKGIMLLADAMDEIIRVKYLPSHDDFLNIRLYTLNIHNLLQADEVSQLLFNPSFMQGVQHFYITTQNHAIAVFRRYLNNPVTGKSDTIVYLFDANSGAFEVGDRDVFLRVLEFSIHDSRAYYSIAAIADITKIEQYKSLYGAYMIDFCNNEILGKRQFKVPLVEIETSNGLLKLEQTMEYNQSLPK